VVRIRNGLACLNTVNEVEIQDLLPASHDDAIGFGTKEAPHIEFCSSLVKERLSSA
jgi:hypothetical protein